MAEYCIADGDPVKVKPKTPPHFTLEELQRYVGGHIEMLGPYGGKMIVINEEGKLADKPRHNRVGTALLHTFSGSSHDWIAGDILICDVSELDMGDGSED